MAEKRKNSINPSRQGWRQFLTARKEMLDAFDKAKEQDEIHKVSTYRGKVAEAEFRNWLSSFLPKKYGVTSGYIISQGVSDDVLAPHFDVIIYEQLESPILWIEDHSDLSSSGSSRAIPAEHVRAVIEVKSSLTPTSAKKAVEHLYNLETLLENVDAQDERYKKYLPSSFFCSIVFFELRKKFEFSNSALGSLIPYKGLRGSFDVIFFRGESLPPNKTGRIFWAISDEPEEIIPKKRKRSLLNGGLITEMQITENRHLQAILFWSEVFFSQYAFDLVALLNGTYDRGKISSFHGLGFESPVD